VPLVRAPTTVYPSGQIGGVDASERHGLKHRARAQVRRLAERVSRDGARNGSAALARGCGPRTQLLGACSAGVVARERAWL
jgi:hypothetical protein